MLNSSTLNSSNTNIMSYLIEDDSTNYSTFLYPFPYSPLISGEFGNFGDFTAFHDEPAIIQQSLLANNNNNNNDNNNSWMDHNTENSSMLGVDNKKDDYSSNKRGDHEEVEVNGIVEDNGEMNHHNIMRSSTNGPNSVLMKKKKRTSNKDRHSKIETAQGLRDRRMRLSREVARDFFGLQDMLGYDKGSTTVEWLMMQSKPAIDELLQAKHGSPSSGVTTMTKGTTISSNSDECDVESTTNEEREANTAASTEKPVTKKEPTQKERRKRTTKEERKVARERAKKRTLERMMQSRGNNPFTSPCNFLQAAAKL